MAADEPPYLTIGTDVSAKYKGAFCEAKIKKVNRIVKCKVTFKNNLGSFVVTDDQIKGTLRLGSDIEAKHPEKNQFHEAVINKLQDYSQYTVVFDDGDETTLRRTSLCLKSGRHFAESPTLDQFPLTNPEHFGTPVIGSGKFKRKRRSTVNSSLDYESSDDDSLPRKLKAIRGKERDPDLGKVVCVDYGDRRKKDNWYPGLIVPLPPHSNIRMMKEEHLVRSFKDGKYYQVPKRDIREFTKECGSKVENNALKTAIEKATLYIEKEELPPHWDKVLFLGLELHSAGEESNDFESDTSDDEPSEEKDRFVAQLYKFMDERGTPINKAPTVSNRDLNLYKLFKIMHKLGGYNKVTNKNKWKTVYSKMGLPHSNANGPNQVKFAYKRYLQSFEDFYRKLGCTMVNNSRSTRGRHRSDRNIIITRTRDREAPKTKLGKEIKDKTLNEKKNDEKLKVVDKKESKSEEVSKSDDKIKITEKRKERTRLEDDKQKREERRRLVRVQSSKADVKREDIKPEKARTREDARKEKNESPEKKGTRSTSKVELDKKEKEDVSKEKKEKSLKEKEKKEEKQSKDMKEEKLKPKKDDIIVKERKSREKKIEDKNLKEKRENPVREKKDLSKEKKDPPKEEKITQKGKKEDIKISPDEKSPKRKLEKVGKEKKEVVKIKSEETDVKETEKKDEKPLLDVKKEEQVLKKPNSGPEDLLSSEEEDKFDNTLLEERRSRLRTESGDDPPNKLTEMSFQARKKSLKNEKGEEKDEKECFHDSSDSDESLTNDSEKVNKELKREIEIGDRVKVKYGRGRMQKVYEAKVLKIETDGVEKRYYVHYAGWNMRYDEWVRKNYIVAIINGSKKYDPSSKSSMPPSCMKKLDRIRFAGSKPVRKNSTSSTNSNVSRSTRSEKKNDSDVKKRSGKKHDATTSAADTSQESDSEREDGLEDEEGNDADIEDSSALQADSSFFKEELFSDDEEKEKLEDVKREDINELEKAITLEQNDGNNSDFFPSTSTSNKTSENCYKPSIQDTTENQYFETCAEDDTNKSFSTDVKLLPEKEDPWCNQTKESPSPVPEQEEKLDTTPPETNVGKTVLSTVSLDTNYKSSISSALNFSGLIKKAEIENPCVQERVSSSLVSESGFLRDFPSINIDKLSENKETSSESDYELNLRSTKTSESGDDIFASRNDFVTTSKSEIHSENALICPETSFSEVVTTEKQSENIVAKVEIPEITSSKPCSELFADSADKVKDNFDVKDTELKTSNVYIPSFSPQNSDQPFTRLKSDNRIQSEAVDVSKMIPGILERLKNDVVTEFDPQKEELTFDFLRDSSSKCASRSDSLSSLRICESDTNDSNHPLHGNESASKNMTETIKVNEHIEEETNKDESIISTVETTEKSNEEISLPRTEFTTLIEEPHIEDVDCVVKNDVFNSDDVPKCPELSSLSSQSSALDIEGDKEAKFNDNVQVKDSNDSFIMANNSIQDPLVVKNDEIEISQVNNDDSVKALCDLESISNIAASSVFQIVEDLNQHPDQKKIYDSTDSLKNVGFPLKKEGKKKKFGKKLGKKFSCSELFEKEDKDSKIKDSKNKTKKKMRFESFTSERMRSLDLKPKSKKLKKNKNKKRFKREESCDSYIRKIDLKEDESKNFSFDKIKRKDKKKTDKKYLKCGTRNDEFGDSKLDLLKKKKGKKNRDKFAGEKKDFSEKKTKKKRKILLDNNQDTDSEKESMPKLEKKRKKKKLRVKDCSSSDEGTDKFYKEETMDFPSTSSARHESKSDDPDMSFLLCEEKVPASPVDVSNLGDDSSASSSMEEGNSEFPNAVIESNINNTSTVMDNTPPTTPSSTESLLSSSPSHERDSFPYPESTQSGRESGDGESDIFRCSSNRTISRGSEEYHAATTLAFAVGQSVSDKMITSDFVKQQKADASEIVKRKKKSKRFRRCSESAKSPKHKSSFLRMPKVENCYEDSSGTSPAAMSCSPPYGTLNFARSFPTRFSSTSEEASSRYIYIPLHEKDPEKRIALLQKKMAELRKEYMTLRAEVIAIDHKRRKARKKVRETAGSVTNPSIHSDDGQSCS